MSTESMMRFHRIVLVLVLVHVLGLPAAAQDVPRTPADTTRLPSPATAPVPMSLHDAVTAASTATPAVSVAVLQEEEARARLRQARSVFFPQVNAAGSFVRRTENLKSFGFSFPLPPGQSLPDLVGPFNIWDFRPQLAQTLFDPSAWARASAARAQVAASAGQAGTTGQTAAAQAASAYVQLAHATALVAARQEDLRLAGELIRDAQAQFNAGVGTRLDVVRARTQEAEARAAVALARTGVTQAEIALARTLGLPPGTRFALRDSLAAALGRSDAPDAIAAAEGLALAQRPELAAAASAVSAARLAARATQAQRLGRLQLAGDYGWNGPKPNDMIRTGQLAVQYSIPFFDGLRLEGQVQEQQALRREAEVRLADLREQVAGEVRTALAALTSGAEQERIAAEQVALAQEELREARLRYTNGVSGNIDVITARADLVRARSAMIDALAQTASARVQLARAVGVTPSLR
ncbi:MAG TPA: TolC family protein [Longimicrobiales bacterium]